jgi:hypothetical protein
MTVKSQRMKERLEMQTALRSKDMKGRGNLEDPGVDDRLILKFILKK